MPLRLFLTQHPMDVTKSEDGVGWWRAEVGTVTENLCEILGYTKITMGTSGKECE